jgi:tripartite-type tricarboxylate transporter receptor subunit TctC
MASGTMNLPRRAFLRLAAGTAAFPAVSRMARAQTYPSRLVRITVGTVSGSSPDIVARLVGQWLSERLGQPFVIDNRPGAGGNIGTEAVVRAPPDGYMLLLVTTANTISTTYYDKLGFNFSSDIMPTAGIIRVPNVIEVHPSLPAKTVTEFIAYAKANPGKINMASSGIGTTSHVSGELFKMMTGIDMVHVPYRGGALALTDLISGQVQVMFDSIPTSIQHIRNGKLRPLAVTTVTRSELLPDIPTVGEIVSSYEASTWYGIGAPRNTPTDLIESLNREIAAGLDDPKMKARLAELGGTTLAGAPADFGRLIADETEKWAKVMKFAGIKPE